MRRSRPLFPMDPGLLFVVAGLFACVTGVLMPDAQGLGELRNQRDQLRQAEELAFARLEAHASFLDQLESGDAELLRRLAADQLNLLPPGHEPLVINTSRSVSVLDWIDATVQRSVAAMPASSPSAAPARRSLLTMLTSGPQRIWYLGAGVMCLFLGIILTPGTTSPGRGRVALTVADEDDDGDSDLSAAEGDVLVEDRFTGQEFEDADTQLELIIDEDPADDVDGSVPVTTAIEAQDLKPAAAPTMPPSLSVLDTDVVLALSTDCTCVIDTMDDDLDAAETPSRPFADLPLFAGVMMYASSAESDAAVGESIQEPPVISIAAREPELLSRIADEDTQPVTDAEPKPDVVESVAAPVDNSTDVDDAEVDNEYEDEYENAADDVDDADEDEDEDDEYEWVYVDEDGNEIPEDEADEYEEIDEEDAEYEDDEFDDDDELDDEEPEDEAIAAKK